MNQPHTPGLETYLEIPMSPEDLAMLAAIAAGGDGTEGDRMFHASVLAAARNLVLVDLLDSLAEGAGKIAAASLGRPGQPPRSLAAPPAQPSANSGDCLTPAAFSHQRVTTILP